MSIVCQAYHSHEKSDLFSLKKKNKCCQVQILLGALREITLTPSRDITLACKYLNVALLTMLGEVVCVGRRVEEGGANLNRKNFLPLGHISPSVHS